MTLHLSYVMEEETVDANDERCGGILFQPVEPRHDLRRMPTVEQFKMDDRAVGMLEGEVWKDDIVAVAFHKWCVANDRPVFHRLFEIAVEELYLFGNICGKIMVMRD